MDAYNRNTSHRGSARAAVLTTVLGFTFALVAPLGCGSSSDTSSSNERGRGADAGDGDGDPSDSTPGPAGCSPSCSVVEDRKGECPGRTYQTCRMTSACGRTDPDPFFGCTRLTEGPLSGESTQCCDKEICFGRGAECIALPDVNGLCSGARTKLLSCCATTPAQRLDCQRVLGEERRGDYCCASAQ